MDADSSGTTRFMMFDSLEPETVYYIAVESGSEADYLISVSDQE